ncbi:MAG TPA: ATP-binding cassette domain-containing protein, partial [Thermomicrobiales bacterium]|nr:ATP-binding cassette domain-containing protein [Thermomicrobiales bacterium]
PAVNGIDLRTEDGEFVVLLGPSGCGKTTLLRMIGGLEKPTSGEILIGDRVVNDLPPRARQIAMVFQSYALYPHMTVYNNISFPLKAAKLGKQEIDQKVRWAAGILGIDQYFDRKPRQLSGGQRQRVALARALVREPNVFLLDEPLSNLDAQRRASARDELQVFQREVGTTTIYVTHDQVEAMGLGDRIAVISEGSIRQFGTPHEIYEDPADTFVATFLGSPPMNLVERGDELLGFRPEAVEFAKSTENLDGSSWLTLTLAETREEYLGSEKLIYGEIGGERVVARTAASMPMPVEEGGDIEIAIPNSALRIFDKGTGLRKRESTLRISTSSTEEVRA